MTVDEQMVKKLFVQANFEKSADGSCLLRLFACLLEYSTADGDTLNHSLRESVYSRTASAQGTLNEI